MRDSEVDVPDRFREQQGGQCGWSQGVWGEPGSVGGRTQRKEEVGEEVEGFLGFSSLICKMSRIIVYISESC